ncbi:MAG: hypothetical protein NZV14_11340 [Bryobacteraceae bacterium]|nr:hypothetical protein [Bryobacteraceae bacterium]MDW8378747.1 hypothetical protein [Bryobacterales bacterium]
MSSYLEGYGAADVKREKLLKRLALGFAGAIAIGLTLYFSFRDYRYERQIRLFVEAVQRQDLKTAYTLWGCTVETPCRDYSFEKFVEDWNPNSANMKAIQGGKLYESERCGTGFIGVVSPNNGKDEVALWVERSTGIVGYAPYRECPEPKLRIVKWLKMRFGNQPAPALR